MIASELPCCLSVASSRQEGETQFPPMENSMDVIVGEIIRSFVGLQHNNSLLRIKFRLSKVPAKFGAGERN